MSTDSRFRACIRLLVAIAALAGAQIVVPHAASAAEPQPAELAGATSLQAVEPCRLFDSRRTPDLGRVSADTWRIQVTGRCAVPDGARAAALNLTVTDVQEPGFVTVWPSDTPRIEVSNVNFEATHTIANSAVVQVSATGTIDVYVYGRAAVIVDVTAAFVDQPGSPAAGRYVPVDPRRVLDTRSSGQRGTFPLAVGRPAGVSADATAVAVTVTAVDAVGWGFLTAAPSSGGPPPDTSTVNTDSLNRTRANMAILPLDENGFVVWRSMETDVLVDIWGYFTGPSDVPSTEGLFIPQAPQRVWDSRHSHDPVHPGGVVERAIAPANAAAVVANVTAIDLTGNGFLTVYGAGTSLPDVSALNYRWRHPVAALTLSRVSSRGVAFYSYAGAHLAVDVAGWFTGTPVPATTGPPPNPWPAEDTPVAFISDSGFAGIRWNGALGLLQGAVFDSRLESCRRLIGVSCRGREGYAPLTAESEIYQLAPYANQTLVMATGYNDWSGSFPTALSAVMAAARNAGVERVVWITYRENVGYVSPYGVSNSSSFSANNAHLRSALATGWYPELVIADWHSYSFGRSSWFASDGVHFTVEGARQAAMYVSRKLAFLERRPCPAGIGGPTAPGGWCADPDVTGPS